METYVLSGARTPCGNLLGALSSVPAPKLGAVAIRGALDKTDLDDEMVDEVFMGHVISAGVGQAPARQAAFFGGLPESLPCSSVNKVCGSGLKSIINGVQSIKSGDNSVVVAGGMENMSLAPHLLANSRSGIAKFGAATVQDAMQWDGLWDVYSNRPMGNCAEECATKYQLTRPAQEAYAIESFKRAQKATEDGIFAKEIVPVTVPGRKGDTVVEKDEGPYKANFDKIPHLKPAFEKDGTITAATASTINDGAAAVVLAGEEYKDQAEFRIVAHATHSHHPTWFTTAPIYAMRKNLDKAGLSVKDIGIFEINEAFSAVPMAAMIDMNIPHEKLNIYGSGLSLGHPIGCSGTRIFVTMMTAMKEREERYGMASLCIGSGEALSIIIERI